jgi:hypothetical protein
MNKSCPSEVPSITKIIVDISSTKVNDILNDNNKSCPTEVPSITKIIIYISSTKVNDIVNDNDKVILTNEICPTEVPPITNLQDNLFPGNKLKTAIINKI